MRGAGRKGKGGKLPHASSGIFLMEEDGLTGASGVRKEKKRPYQNHPRGKGGEEKKERGKSSPIEKKKRGQNMTS